MKTENQRIIELANNKNFVIYVDTLWLLKHSMQKNHNAADLMVRLMAVENYFGENDFGFELYNKMQKIRVLNNPRVPNYRAYNQKRFIKIIESFKANGFMENHPLVLNEDFTLFEGTHRMACALYFKIKRVPVTFDSQIIERKTDYSFNWFIRNGLKEYPNIIKNRYKRLLEEWE